MNNHLEKISLPLVSVVIASYNHAPFVIEALNSIADQTYASLELIVIDDCSQDDSVALIKQWAAKPSNKKRFLRLLIETAEKNTGAHNTLNRGVTLAQGRFVNFLNSDDYFDSERITTLVNNVTAENAIWGFTGVKVVDGNGREISSANLPSEVGFVYEGIEHARNHYPSLSCGLLERNFIISTGNIFVETTLFRQLNGFRNLRYLHDWDFILRATRIAEPIAIDDPLYAYRLHGANSFKSLANIAAVEGTFVMRDHLHALAIHPQNSLAPSPNNWPVLYDTWVDNLGLRHLAPNQNAFCAHRSSLTMSYSYNFPDP